MSGKKASAVFTVVVVLILAGVLANNAYTAKAKGDKWRQDRDLKLIADIKAHGAKNRELCGSSRPELLPMCATLDEQVMGLCMTVKHADHAWCRDLIDGKVQQ